MGDIDALHKKWKELQDIINSTDPPQITEADLKRHWDEVEIRFRYFLNSRYQLYEIALLIPNTSHQDVPVGGLDNAKVATVNISVEYAFRYFPNSV